MAKWLWLLISLLLSIIQSFHCCAQYGVRALYGARETSEVFLLGMSCMSGDFLRVLSFLSDLLICDRR